MVEQEKTWDFDQWAGNYDGWVASDDPVYARYGTVLARVIDLSGASKGKRILDIGTGTGNLAGLLLDRGAEVFGLDPSRKMLDLAAVKLRGREGLELKQVAEPFLEIPYDDGAFDAVVSTYAFHHVHPSRKPACILEMLRVLKPGGIWVTGDLIFQDEEDEQEALASHDWLEEEYYTKIADLLPLFREMGMTLKSEQYTMITWVLWATKPGSV
jgi:putative AdoMet-dependent methyltransferase